LGIGGSSEHRIFHKGIYRGDWLCYELRDAWRIEFDGLKIFSHGSIIILSITIFLYLIISTPTLR
jgi:hypothetical protein